MKTYTWTEFCLHLYKNGPIEVETTEVHQLVTTQFDPSVVVGEPSFKIISLLGNLAPCKARLHLEINKYYLRDHKDVEKVVSSHNSTQALCDCLDIFITPHGSVVSYILSGVNNPSKDALLATDMIVKNETKSDKDILRQLFTIIKASAV